MSIISLLMSITMHWK